MQDSCGAVSDSGVTVTPLTAAHNGALNGTLLLPCITPIVPASTAPAEYARPALALISRDDIAAAVAEFDAYIDEAITPVTPALHGTVTEIDGEVLTLFRFAMGGRPVIIDIPTELCSPAVRAQLYGLFVAIEREAATRAGRSAAPGAGLTILPSA